MILLLGLIGVTLLAIGRLAYLLWRQQAAWPHYLLGGLIPLFAWTAYVQRGAYTAVLQYQIVSTYTVQIDHARNQDVEALMRLEPRLPLHPAVWSYLGEVYLQLDRPDLAIHALDTAVHANSASIEAVPDRLALANAYFIRDQGHIAPEVDEQLQQILMLMPNHTAARNLHAISAFEKGDYATAIHDWRSLRTHLQDWALQTQILQAIAKAQALQNAQQPPEAQIPVVEVTVHLTPEVEATLTPQSTLFVTAHLVTEPQMPWAAVKEPIENLPMLVRFSEDLALRPQTTWKVGDAVWIKAQYAPEGEKIHAAGNWVATPQMVYITGGNQSLSLMIDRRSMTDGHSPLPPP